MFWRYVTSFLYILQAHTVKRFVIATTSPYTGLLDDVAGAEVPNSCYGILGKQHDYRVLTKFIDITYTDIEN